MYVFSNFYFAYIELSNSYNPNTFIDASYTLTATLFAFSAYARSIYADKPKEIKNVNDNLPYNYGKTKNTHIAIAFLVLGLFYTSIGLSNFLILVILAAFYILASKYIQISIQTEHLLKKEIEMNDNLEKIIEEKTYDLKKANKLLEDISNKDNLTGLYNRRYFLNHMQELIDNESCNKFALLYIDMDRFKVINDAHGHEVGDKVIVSLSKRFANHCKKGCNVYRIGGDEFAIIAENYVDLEELEIIIKTLLKISQHPIVISPYTFSIDISIGIAKYPKDSKDKNTLLKFSDIAMYEAKNSHSNIKYFFFDNILNEKVQEKHHLEVMLKNANFDKEFQLYFQPQYTTKDHALVGMEALLRWFHPQEGFISPADFIPIAEETSIIFDLGEWVLNNAISQVKIWNNQYNLDLQVGINISPIQIENSDFVNRIRQKIHNKNIKPEWIDLEITEGVAMSSQVSMEEIFSGLASIGISISIDDFGTGYSSLSYIKRFDIDRLKIAKELIDNIAEDKNTLLIVKAIIMMARGMGLKTIAEGVEDSNQLEILKVLECDEIQGYIFGRPVPPDIFELEHIDKTTHS